MRSQMADGGVQIAEPGDSRFSGRRVPMLVTGLVMLAAAWLVPWSAVFPGPFAAHMTRHVGVVAIAAPCLALAIAGSRFDPSRHWPVLFGPIVASLSELIVIWGWHAPALHHAARSAAPVFALEQGSFLVTGLVVWLAAFGGRTEDRAARSATGVVVLLFTLMHMTLLGALLGLSPRPLYVHNAVAPANVLADQHLGAAIMLTVTAVSYLAGGLWLSHRLIAHRARTVSSRDDPPATGVLPATGH
ncbi:MAG TPA: cytochrome c oxidase assembly protein [Gemmatimonadaceae bacterium]